MIMESEKSLDLHSASWRHSRDNSVVSKSEGLKPGEPMVYFRFECQQSWNLGRVAVPV